MRTTIALTPDQVSWLDEYRVRKNISRAAAIRAAVDLLLEREDDFALDEVFGCLSTEQANELRARVAELHGEWEREWSFEESPPNHLRS